MHNKLLEIKPQNTPVSQVLYKQENLHQQAKSRVKIVQGLGLDSCDDRITSQYCVENDLL